MGRGTDLECSESGQFGAWLSKITCARVSFYRSVSNQLNSSTIAPLHLLKQRARRGLDDVLDVRQPVDRMPDF